MHSQAGQEQRQAEEEGKAEDRGKCDRAGDLFLADYHVLAAGVHVRGPDQRLHAQVQLLADQREAAQQRKLPDRVDVDGRLQLAAVDHDLPFKGVRVQLGQAHGNRVVALAAHHHAFDDGLAAIEELILLYGSSDLNGWGGRRSRNLPRERHQ